ncbi:MAG: hypothetical protein H0V73_12800, partial [Chloroflexi bacterium]|nr:hypothetical protein [Chloroflexota bacterium]
MWTITTQETTRLPANDRSIRVLRTRVLHGPNRWSRLPIVHLRVDLGALEQLPTNLIAGFGERLLASLPGLANHACSTGLPGGFVGRMAEGTWLGHVVEHAALELQRAAGGEPTRGKTRAAGPDGIYDIVFAFDDEAVGRAAGAAAVDLVNGLVDGDRPVTEAAEQTVRTLRALADSRR